MHIIESLGRGGAERQLVNQLLAHDSTLIRPSVVTLNPPLDLADELRSAGIAVMTLNLPAFGDMPFAMLRLIGIIKLLRPDIIHTWLARADLSGRMAAVLSGLPVVSAVQAPMYEPTVFLDNPRQKKWKLEIVRKLDQVTSRVSNTLHVACSHLVQTSIQRALYIKPSRVRVIYNGVQLSNMTPHQFSLRLITVGRLSPEKGHRYLLEAMPTILAHHPTATLQIVGDGPLRVALQTHTETLGLTQSVAFLGSRKDVPKLLAKSDLFVFPSLWEGLPLVPLEALSIGLPVIASDIPALREIVDDGIHGILVPSQNPQALAHAIINLLDNPKHGQALGIAGRERIAERFDITVTVRQWEQLYRDVAAR